MRPDEPLRVAPASDAPRRGAAIKGARLPVYGARPGPGCAGSYFLVGPLAWICSEGVSPSLAPPGGPPATPSERGLPYRYFFVGSDGSFGYRVLDTAELGVPEAQLQPGFGVAVARVAPKPPTGDPFGLTTHGMWVPLRDLRGPVTPRESLAIELGSQELVWVIGDSTPVHTAPGGARRRDLGLVRFARVPVEERLVRGGVTWLRIADRAWIRESATAGPRRTSPPEGLRANERWIDVDLERQVVTAYVGEHPEFATLVSTGRGKTGTELATPKGAFRVWVKLRASDMDNLENLEANENYAIQAVPWVMYFHRGYGLHGAFWHDAFGRVQSHGCVNVVPEDAERLFRWTSPRLPEGWSAVFPTDYELGTLVSVR